MHKSVESDWCSALKGMFAHSYTVMSCCEWAFAFVCCIETPTEKTKTANFQSGGSAVTLSHLFTFLLVECLLPMLNLSRKERNSIEQNN